MLDSILPFMRCPRCADTALHRERDGLRCRGCRAFYPVKMGILDMVESEAREVITPFQRVMQTPLVVSIYEKLWRRIGYYLASSRSFSREMQTVLRLARHRNHGRVLDLACGPGVFTRPLALQSDAMVVGLDLSWPMLRHAQKELQKKGMQTVLLIHATAFALPFVDGAFQYVNCCGALHLFDRPEAALKEIARVLDKKGFLCVQTTIRPARSAGMAYFLEKFIRFGFFDEGELRELLSRHGFEVSEGERHRISFTFLAKCRE
ncbi:MAG TPA: methyltransferase domain-containing protein [Acidobacteriota bacterium]|nr:methyltransferase domain-containing protein [Acidobacteriota bacterium]